MANNPGACESSERPACTVFLLRLVLIEICTAEFVEFKTMGPAPKTYVNTDFNYCDCTVPSKTRLGMPECNKNHSYACSGK